MNVNSSVSNSSVSIKDLSLNFGAVSVLKDLNLDINDGEFLVLLGSSGCGKSTLLNCIAGLLDASEGQIFIKGKNVTWEEPKDRGIGMVFQSYALYPQMTVEKNLSFGLRVAKVPQAEIDKRVARASEIQARWEWRTALAQLAHDVAFRDDALRRLAVGRDDHRPDPL